MRLKATTDLKVLGAQLSAGDVFDAPDAIGLYLINREQAIPFNLEDPHQRSTGAILGDALRDVPAVSISPQSESMDAASGTGSFTVTITGPGLSGQWTATKDSSADWLTIDYPTEPQTESGDVDYTVDANAGAQRSANIYVNGKTFTVTQAAAA